MYPLYNKVKPELVYLASPYSKYSRGVNHAFKEVSKKAAELMVQGYNIFCPIAHSHAVEGVGMAYGVFHDRKDGDFWLKQDFAVLANCSKLLVYKMPGWDTSYGVGKEIEFAKNNNIPVEYLEYEAVRTNRETEVT